MKLLRVRLAALAAALVVAAVSTSPAAAAPIGVTTTVDELGSVAGCSLREAVQAANTNMAVGGCPAGDLASPDVITLPDGTYALTLFGADEEANTTGDLDLAAPGGDVTIQAAGPGRPTIDGLQDDRIIDVQGGGDLELAGVRLFGGSTDPEFPLPPLPEDERVGGALRWAAPSGSLTVTDSVIEQNAAIAGSAIALFSSGVHSVTDSVLSQNLGVDLGAIHSQGPLTITRTSISGNNGGGIRVEAGPAGALTIAQSTITGTIPSDAGTGAISADGDVSITNSTIHNNGGGFVGALTTPGDITVRFSTITENFGPGSAANNVAGGIDSFTAGSVVLEGVVLAGNFNGLNPSNCNEAGVTETGPNLEDQDSCGLAGTSQVNADPQLAPLASNGGPTPTRGLYPGSPALDQAPACGVPTDQRGTARGDAACDLGAFEGTVARPVTPAPAGPAPAKKCKAKKPRCCSKKERKRGKPRYCRKKKPERRAASAREVIGRSVQGRPIVATRIGDPDAERVALVAGVIHGDERAGLRVIAELKREWANVEGVQLWLLKTLNPDGQRAGMRKNAHGVDLNRNFPADWKGGVPPSSGYYPGSKPASEPETRAAMAFIRRIQPDVSIWYHQPWGAVLACRGRPALAARYAALAKMRTSCRGRGLPGTVIGWQKEELAGTTAFVVEFAGGATSARTARRHARAAAIVARDGPAASAAGAGAAATAKPAIRKRLIPYPAGRLNDMAGYSKRHYGEFTYRLDRPRQIVMHFAVAGSIDSIYNTFAPNRPDPEFGELPNVCSHFAVGAAGEIVKFVPTNIRCRHVVGLNHVSLGIEHVGFSDGEVLGRKREFKASLRLTHFLRCRFGISVKNVIGHNESLSSPFYKELDPDFRGQTHGDFKRSSMRVYRRALARRGDC